MNKLKIFVSYSRKDSELIAPLTQLLRISGNDVFRDEDSIELGHKWRISIEDSLNLAKTVIVFWSINSSESTPVQEEYTSAISQNKDVVPILLDDTPLDDSLSEYQWLDFRPFLQAASFRGIGLGASIGAIVGTAPIAGVSGIGSLAGAAIGAIATKLKRGIKDDLNPEQKAELVRIVYDRILPNNAG